MLELFGQPKEQNNISLLPRNYSNSYLCLVVIGVLVSDSVTIIVGLASVVLNWEEIRNGTYIVWNNLRTSRAGVSKS